MRNLRARLTRLAYTDKSLRPHLLPLLTGSKEASGTPDKRELERLRHLSERGDEFATELLARWESRGGGKWYEIARLELSVEEKTEVHLEQKGRDFGGVQYVRMRSNKRGRSGESEWIVFQSTDDAEKYAEAYVEEQLQEEPGIFNQNWLSGFLTVSDTTKRIISSEEADNYVSDLDDERVLEEADLQADWDEIQEAIEEATEQQEDADEKEWKKLQTKIEKLERQQESLLEQGREKILEEYAETILERLEDPLEYASDLGYDLERGLPDWIQIDTAAAAKSAIGVDGVAHFLDSYDGSELELPSGAVAFGTN